MNAYLINKTLFCFFSRHVLFFLFFMIPLHALASDTDNGVVVQTTQLSGDIHVAEGTVIYNQENIYQVGKESPTSRHLSKPKVTKKKSALSKAKKKKPKKVDQYVKKISVEIQFKPLPPGDDVFFSKSSSQYKTLLPVTQHLKVAGVLQQGYISFFYNDKRCCTLINQQNIADNLSQRRLQIRPPPVS